MFMKFKEKIFANVPTHHKEIFSELNQWVNQTIVKEVIRLIVWLKIYLNPTFRSLENAKSFLFYLDNLLLTVMTLSKFRSIRARKSKLPQSKKHFKSISLKH